MAYAQEDLRGNLEGTVLSASGTPASDALIRVIGQARVVRTSESGQFIIGDLTPGLLVVEIISPRWGSNMIEVEIIAGETLQEE